MSSLMLCDKIVKAIDAGIKADFQGLDTRDTSDGEPSEEKAKLYLSVFEGRGDDRRHLGWYSILVARVGVGRYYLHVYASTTLGPWKTGAGPDARELMKLYGRPGLSVEERTRYHQGLEGELAADRRLEASVGYPFDHDPFSRDVGLDELESRALLTEVARKASDWLGLPREVSQVAEGHAKASGV